MGQVPESATFLSALAQRIDLRVLVYVPAARRARVLWLTPTGPEDEEADEGADEGDALEAIGRAVLAAGRDRLRTWTAAQSAQFSSEPRVAIAVVRTREGEPAGVVVAGKERGHEWSSAEHALLEFTAGFYARELQHCASRPLPARTVDWSSGWRRAEADELESGMRDAADNGELYLLYQPEVDLASKEVIAVEALTRWLHPQHGELGPDSFIALAERSELIDVLGAWLLEESFRDFGSWQQALPDLDVVLRINVSPAQLVRPGVADQFAAALDRHGMRGEQVCVELTESVALTDFTAVARALGELKNLGVASAIDDLASGYSSLTRLRAFDVDLVKLDRGLVQGIDADQRAQVIVRGIVRLASELGVGVTAEGVESSAEAQTLVQLGCRSAQGHYFARPQSGTETVALLTERARRRRRRIADV